MKGGVILFRGTGAAARRYLESDRSRADEYYLEGGVAPAELSVVDGTGSVVGERALTAVEYAGWVDWIDPLTRARMGTPRQAGEVRQGSPRFAEMVVNTPKSLSIAAALHPDVSAALDGAQRDAVAEIRSWLGQHSVTRIGPRGKQEVVPVERLETVAISHKTSRAGDPHRHIHFQIVTRVWAGGGWRGLDTAALFRQQGAIRALGTAVLAAHPQLAAVLDGHGLTLDPVTGEVAELEGFNAVLSKRADQVARNLAVFEGHWQAAHPGQEPGRVVSARLQAKAWDHQRPNKRPSQLGSEAGWRRELDEAGYTPDLPRAPQRIAMGLDDLRVQQVANRALDRCAAAASTWTVHDIQAHVTRIITETGVRAEPGELSNLIAITTRLAAGDCLSVLPPGAVRPEHVAHLTNLHVVQVDTQLRDLLTARAARPPQGVPDVHLLARERGLDDEQATAAAAVASGDALVVVEGAAGAGKTTMLGVAIKASLAEGHVTRIVTPTKKAADVAARELAVPADSVAKLAYDHGFRWNHDGVWTRLVVGEVDPANGTTYIGPPAAARLRQGERVVVDEAGMLDQDTAVALLQIADEAGASLALVGDRAQLPAVGRGGVLDIAAQLCGRTFDMATVHRFTDPAYADLTVQMRQREIPALLFDRLNSLGLVQLHPTSDDANVAIARSASEGDAVTAATNDEARALNTAIRHERVRRGEVDDDRVTYGSDGLPIGAGDIIATRSNDSRVGVANRQTWTVQHITTTGEVWARQTGTGREHRPSIQLPARYVSEHTHLAYAATAYGVQAATTPAAHTVLTDALDGSAMYVGMTRGRDRNTLHIVAVDLEDAREQFTTALRRDRADRGLTAATRAAREAVAALVPAGPVTFVNAERTRLREQIQAADKEAARMEHALRALTQLSAAHDAEYEQQAQIVATADAHAAAVRAEIAAPLIEQATTDGTACRIAQERMWQANHAPQPTGWFGKRAAARAVRDANDSHGAAEDAVRRRWADVPLTMSGIPAWAETVVALQVEANPRMIEARQDAERALLDLQQLTTDHAASRSALLRESGAGHWPSNLEARAAVLRGHAQQARRTLDQIEALPISEATQLIQDKAAEAAAERTAKASLRARAAETDPWHSPFPEYERDFGPSL